MFDESGYDVDWNLSIVGSNDKVAIMALCRTCCYVRSSNFAKTKKIPEKAEICDIYANTECVEKNNNQVNQENQETHDNQGEQLNLESDVIGFFYGGDVIKAGRIRFFVTKQKDIDNYIGLNINAWYGSVDVRYIECDDVADKYDKLMALAKEKKYVIDNCSNFLSCNIHTGMQLLQEICQTNRSIKRNNIPKGKGGDRS